MSDRAPKTEYTIFTAEGVSFIETGRTLAQAVARAKPLVQGRTIVAVVESDSIVAPSPGKLTALIVRPPQPGSAGRL